MHNIALFRSLIIIIVLFLVSIHPSYIDLCMKGDQDQEPETCTKTALSACEINDDKEAMGFMYTL